VKESNKKQIKKKLAPVKKLNENEKPQIKLKIIQTGGLHDRWRLVNEYEPGKYQGTTYHVPYYIPMKDGTLQQDGFQNKSFVASCKQDLILKMLICMKEFHNFTEYYDAVKRKVYSFDKYFLICKKLKKRYDSNVRIEANRLANLEFKAYQKYIKPYENVIIKNFQRKLNLELK